MEQTTKINVIGLGYVGLPTAVLLAQSGCLVSGIDVNAEKISSINQGMNPISEPELDDILNAQVNANRLKASFKPKAADVHIIAVPTPRIADDVPDLSHIEQAFSQLMPIVKAGDLVIIESTCPVGTTEKAQERLASARPDLNLTGQRPDIAIAYCPERVLPGQILKELKRNDRIIGGLTPHCAQTAKRFYEAFIAGHCHRTSARTAEIAKLTENAFRDINIAFANELSMICDKLKVDVWELIELVNHHPRVNLLKPGPGVGGHCIAVDPWFIVNSAPDESRLVRMARHVNDSKPEFVINKIHEAVMAMPNAHIGCFGLTFKANVADLRESPALYIAQQLATTYQHLDVVEPHINALPPSLSQHAAVKQVSMEAAWDRANVVVILVDHDAFTPLVERDLSSKIVVDTRGLIKAHPHATHQAAAITES